MNTVGHLKTPVTLMKLTCYGYLGFALLWWLATMPSIDLPARLILDISDWPIDGSHDNLSRDARFITAIGSGLLTGLSLLLLLVVIPEIEYGNQRIVRGTIFALVGWYVVDSLGCILLGIISNAILNTLYLLMFLVPLLMASKAMRIHNEHLR